ncbi:MAG: alpha-E domain-containing protein [Chromatiales bacterium]|jgi:uncharacterized alpha-E superfamily protein
MLSRVAETIYWMGRYLERAENTARLINVNANLLLELPRGITPGWMPMIRILGCVDEYHERHDEVTERRISNFLITDESNPGSILSMIEFARENARTIRDILPREVWEELNTFHQRIVETKAQSYSRASRQDYLLGIIGDLQLMTGLMAGTMNHDTAYHFLNLGKKLERADMTTRIIDVKAENPIPDDVPELHPFQDMLWMSMLESLGAYQMYRKSMHVRISRADVLTFLLNKKEFPRSLGYCNEQIHFYLSCLPNNTEPMAILQHIERVINDAPMQEMDDKMIHDFINELQICLGYLHNSITEAYFPAVEELAIS